MKYVKMLGLAALAATALMAFAASSASADVLCKAAPNSSGECSTTSGDYASGTEFTAEALNPKLTVTGGAVSEVVCERSNTTLKNTETGTSTGGAGVKGEITDLTFTGNCHAGIIGCTVTTGSGYKGKVIATGDKGSGNFTVEGSTTTTVTCGGIFACSYTTNDLTLGYTGGNPAQVVASNESLATEAGGTGCGSEAHWTATYKATGANSAVWVATKMA